MHDEINNLSLVAVFWWRDLGTNLFCGSEYLRLLQYFPHLIQPKVHYHVHNSLSFIPVWIQINAVYTIPSHPICLRFMLIILSLLFLGFPCGLFLFCSVLPHNCHSPLPPHHPWFDALVVSGEYNS